LKDLETRFLPEVELSEDSLSDRFGGFDVELNRRAIVDTFNSD
jgi:hypothetical protein